MLNNIINEQTELQLHMLFEHITQPSANNFKQQRLRQKRNRGAHSDRLWQSSKQEKLSREDK